MYFALWIYTWSIHFRNSYIVLKEKTLLFFICRDAMLPILEIISPGKIWLEQYLLALYQLELELDNVC